MSGQDEKPKTQANFATAGLRSSLRSWGESALPPMGLSSLVLAQSLRPFRVLNLAFLPVFLGSAYINVLGMKADAAGLTASWSCLYLLLNRYQVRKMAKSMIGFGSRSVIHAGTQATCIMNMVACGYVYVTKKGLRFNTPDAPR